MHIYMYKLLDLISRYPNLIPHICQLKVGVELFLGWLIDLKIGIMISIGIGKRNKVQHALYPSQKEKGRGYHGFR